MVHVPDEIIMAYADGQVSAEEKAWFESMLATDPALRSRLNPFVATGPGQFSAFDAVLSAPIPDRLLETVRGTTPAAKKKVAQPGLFERLFPNGFGLMPVAGYAAALRGGHRVGLRASWDFLYRRAPRSRRSRWVRGGRETASCVGYDTIERQAFDK